MLSAPDIAEGFARVTVAVVVLVAYTLIRTIWPIVADPRPLRRSLSIVSEAAGVGILVAATGYYESPIAFSLIPAVCVAGFISGFGVALRLAGALTFAIGIPFVVDGQQLRDDIRLTSQWAVELFLVAIVAAYARRITGDADVRHNLALDRLGKLADANDLLFSLHQVAQELPSSLDQDEVLDSTLARLRELVEFDTAAIVVREDSDESWTVARHHGARFDRDLDRHRLPPPIGQAIESGSVVAIPELTGAAGPGLAPRAVSGLYARLTARENVVGVIALERDTRRPFEARDAELLAGFAEPAALAIDNARWFARLRTVGADEERMRIARDLHDRIGQSLAYLAFELDRIVRKDEKGDAVGTDLTGIREDVRGVVREVRDTLYDLRTDVTDERAVGEVLAEFGERVQQRSGIEVSIRVDETVRLPRLQERELWRIAQEAIVNAERHSGCSRIEVLWIADGSVAIVEVRDDGRGLPLNSQGRIDSYGMLGMRERAAAVGAQLSVESTPRRGVRVRATIPVAEAAAR